MEKRASVQTAKESFIDYMEQLLLLDLFLPGERLPSERDLARKMKLSRPVIHEGLLELGARGLISIRPRHGWIVNNFTEEGSLSLLNSLYRFSSPQVTGQIDSGLEELRRIILTESLKKFFETKAPEMDCAIFSDELEHINEQGRKILKIKQLKAVDIQKAAEYDFLFYRKIIEWGGNIVFTLLFNSSKALYHQKIEDFFIRYPDSIQKAADLKSLLITAIRSNAVEEARILLARMTSYHAYEA